MASSFHLSLPCLSIKATRDFYVNLVGATLGRQAQNWLDVNLHGNQITFTKAGKYEFNSPNYTFEKTVLPAFHFGVILELEDWQKTFERLKAHKIKITGELKFLKDKKGQHSSFFVTDPNGYSLEFKCFNNSSEVFSTNV